METTELERNKIRLLSDGKLVQKDADGNDRLVATYKNGNVEFATKTDSVKLYQQVVAVIGTTANGTEPSGRTIKSISVQGGPPVKIAANAPKKPKMGKLGDATPEVVEWYLTYNLQEAIIRYGIYCDAKGNPIKRDVRRIVRSLVDQRDLTDDQIEPVADGSKTKVKGPVSEGGELILEKNQIIARRATAYTFTPGEIDPKDKRGGVDNDSEEEEQD